MQYAGFKVYLNPAYCLFKKDFTAVIKVLKNIEDIDYLLIMTVKSGEGGQKFKGEILEKIRRIRRHYPELEIVVDGGYVIT